MMFQLKKEFTFEAAHLLPWHDGKCARLHGHSWKMVVYVCGNQLQKEGPKMGMMVDYSSISEVVKPFVDEYLDHHYLNNTTGLPSPTSEELARWIYNYLIQKIPELYAIEVKETCTSSCLYIP